MTERCPCLAARYRGATCTNNSRLARKLIVDLTIPPARLAHQWRVQGDSTREANTCGRVPCSVSQLVWDQLSENATEILPNDVEEIGDVDDALSAFYRVQVA